MLEQCCEQPARSLRSRISRASGIHRRRSWHDNRARP